MTNYPEEGSVIGLVVFILLTCFFSIILNIAFAVMIWG